ncbi:MAG: ATP-binding protein, partial [Victivallales bacterium]|nr:ATP-binding protein [Victivallales bacterium]
LFEETFLIHLVSRQGKLNEQLRSPKKLYAGDLGIRVMFTGFRDVGSLFENYVYLKISAKSPRFVLEDGIEIDFITTDKQLFEIKYYSEMTEKQSALFNRLKVRDRHIIASVDDLSILDERTTGEDPPMLKEPSTPYRIGSEMVDLGRGPHMEVMM